MPKVGDKVVIDGTKVGAVKREGNLVGVVGRLIRVRWADGSETLLSPGAGSIRFEPGTAKGAGGKTASKTASKAASKTKSAPKKR